METPALDVLELRERWRLRYEGLQQKYDIVVSVPSVYLLTPPFAGAFGGVSVCGRMAPRVYMGIKKDAQGFVFEPGDGWVLDTSAGHGRETFQPSWIPPDFWARRASKFLSHCTAGRPFTPKTYLTGARFGMLSEIPHHRGWMLTYSMSLATAIATHLLAGHLPAWQGGASAFDAQGDLKAEWRETLELAWCLTGYETNVIPAAYPFCAALQTSMFPSVVVQSNDPAFVTEYRRREFSAPWRDEKARCWFPRTRKMRVNCREACDVNARELPTIDVNEHLEIAVLRTLRGNASTASLYKQLRRRVKLVMKTAKSLRERIREQAQYGSMPRTSKSLFRRYIGTGVALSWENLTDVLAHYSDTGDRVRTKLMLRSVSEQTALLGLTLRAQDSDELRASYDVLAQHARRTEGGVGVKPLAPAVESDILLLGRGHVERVINGAWDELARLNAPNLQLVYHHRPGSSPRLDAEVRDGARVESLSRIAAGVGVGVRDDGISPARSPAPRRGPSDTFQVKWAYPGGRLALPETALVAEHECAMARLRTDALVIDWRASSPVVYAEGHELVGEGVNHKQLAGILLRFARSPDESVACHASRGHSVEWVDYKSTRSKRLPESYKKLGQYRKIAGRLHFWVDDPKRGNTPMPQDPTPCFLEEAGELRFHPADRVVILLAPAKHKTSIRKTFSSDP